MKSPTAEFQALQERLPPLWNAIQARAEFEHTTVVVPSLSVDQEELAKIEGAAFYEERLLFSLMRLRHPSARVIYVTSQPVHPEIVDYYLHLLQGVPPGQARRRLTMLCVQDASPRPLTEKILERPLLLARLRRLIERPRRAYLTCFNVTSRERDLALRLGIPLNGPDPDLLAWGGKSGSRQAFALAGVEHPAGFENVVTRSQIVGALVGLQRVDPSLTRAVLKLNHSFSGEGNAIFVYPEADSSNPASAAALDAALETNLTWGAPHEHLDHYLRKFAEMGGIVEAFVEAAESHSPSVQLRVHPNGQLEVVSSHDQVLGGVSGQMYQGCRFPADDQYRSTIVDAARRIGTVLRDEGVIGRFGIDFVVTRNPGTEWQCHAIEINLRMGGTTPPFLALQFLTGGRLNDQGHFVSRGGTAKYYRATDYLYSAAYRGLLPEDLIDITVRHAVRYDSTTETGVLFHMIGAVSQYGKLGITAIGDSREQADELFVRTAAILEKASGPVSRTHRLKPLLERPWSGIE